MRSTCSVSTSPAARARCRRLDRWVHRLSAAARCRARRGARRRPRPTPRAPSGRPPGHEPRTAQRPPRRRRADRRPVDLVVGDLSFISLRLVIPALVALCQPGAPMVLLVKPQFEAGRQEVDRGRGIITDPAIHDRVRTEIDDGTGRRRLLVRGMDRLADHRCRRQPGVPRPRTSTASGTAPMTSVAVVAHHERSAARALAEQAAAWCAEHGVDVLDAGRTTPTHSISASVRASGRSPRPISCSASAATARCCAACGCSMVRRCRCSASTSARSATSPRSNPIGSPRRSTGSWPAPSRGRGSSIDG